ncbi:InlB B-repeat-containing protein [Cohnella terricola]|uniref:InlB B-repeat-containing protein n=1 Tax=Cohnella terricola TaxID=1289167 RepID=UPI001FE87411|nr:InlB B-repeat-containing protein [Cohnella terricola]
MEGTSPYSGDGEQAKAVALKNPVGVAVDNTGNLYITDSAYHMIFKVNTSGQISRFAGTGTAGKAGNDGPAIDAQLNAPKGLEFGRNGELYVISSQNTEIKVVQKGFKVLYNGNGNTGGSAPEPKIYNHGTVVKASDKGSLVRQNSTFESWNTQADGNGATYKAGDQLLAPESTLTLYAKWKLNEYSLNYVEGAGGTITGNLSQVITHGGSGTAVTAKANTGYVFDKWSDGKTNATRTDINVTGNLNFTAQFKELKYKVTYNVNGGVAIPAEDVGVNNYAPNPIPTREGHTFKGWFSNVGLTDAINLSTTPIVKDTTVYAKWEINQYILNYGAGSNGTLTGITYQNVTYGGNGTAVTAVPDLGYAFDKWSDGKTEATRSEVSVSKNVAVTASFVKLHDVSFVVNGGTSIPPQQVKYYSKVAVPTTTRDGYELVGWYSDNAMTIPFDLANNLVLRDLTLYAKWKIKSYTLTYTAGPNGKVNGAPSVTQNVNHGANGPVVTAEPDQGYVFVKWDDNKAQASRTDLNVMANINVTAIFDLLKYRVNFESNGGTPIAYQDVVANGTVVLPTPPSKAGHTFEGWYADIDLKNAFVASTPITSARTLYAKWKIIQYTLNYTADVNGTVIGNVAQTVDYGNNGTPVTAVPNSGYAFEKWSDGNINATRTDTNIPGTINVTAQFVKLHTVTFTVDGGDLVPSQSVKHNQLATVPTTTKEGFGFVGWFSDSAGINAFDIANTPITDDITLYAKWALNTYTLTYSTDGNGIIEGIASQLNMGYGTDGTEVTAKPNPGYIFLRWDDGKTEATRKDTNVTGDIDAKALFSKLHTVNFVTDGGSPIDGQIVMDNKFADASVTTKDGFTFAGWYLEPTLDTLFNIVNTPITADTILYAKWVILPPGAPALQSAIPGDGTVTIEWTSVAHADDYQVFMSSTSGNYDPQSAVSVTGSVYSYQATGLTNGTTYYFIVKAINAGGGIASNEVSATPRTVPGAPTDVVATAGNGQATISFKEPTNSGGSPITGYKVISSIGNLSVTGPASPITISGLTNGTSYTFTVEAINIAGNGIASIISNAVTPTAPIAPPAGGGGGGVSPVTSYNGKITIPIGNAGVVSLGNEIEIAIPSNASSKQLELTIEKLLNTQGLMVNKEVLASTVYEVLKNFPENFGKPVTLTLKFDATKIKNGQTVEIFYFDEAKKVWVKVEGGKINGDRISVNVDHFTKFAVLVVDAKTGLPVTEGVATAPETTETPTNDVKLSDIAGHWAAANIREAVKQGIVQGYADGTFKPNATVTRAEFAVMLINALKPASTGAELRFADNVKIGGWAREAIAQAVQENIIKGFSDGTFRPSANLTRAEMASIVANALKLAAEKGTATSFSDDKSIPTWAKGSIAELTKLGIMQGKSGNKFDAAATATRAEAVTILLKMLAHAGK